MLAVEQVYLFGSSAMYRHSIKVHRPLDDDRGRSRQLYATIAFGWVLRRWTLAAVFRLGQIKRVLLLTALRNLYRLVLLALLLGGLV